MSAAMPVVPLGRIIGAGEARLYNDAREALDLARQRAAAIIAEAEAAAQEIRAAAHQAGQDEARAEAVAMLAETAAAIRKTVDGAAGEIAEAIGEAAGRIIGTLGLKAALPAAARLAVTELRDRHGVVLRVAPSAVDAITAGCADLPGLRVEADAGLNADDCVIVTASGTIQAGLSRQLGILRAALADAAAP